MPQKAKEMMEKLVKLSQDALFKLETEPTSTVEYINLFTFLQGIQEKANKMLFYKTCIL